MNKQLFSECLKKQIQHTNSVNSRSNINTTLSSESFIKDDSIGKLHVDSFTEQLLSDDFLSNQESINTLIRNFKNEIKDSNVRALLLLNLSTISVKDKSLFFNRIFPLFIFVFKEQSFFFRLAILKSIDSYLESYELSDTNIKLFLSFFKDSKLVHKIMNQSNEDTKQLIYFIKKLFKRLNLDQYLNSLNLKVT